MIPKAFSKGVLFIIIMGMRGWKSRWWVDVISAVVMAVRVGVRRGWGGRYVVTGIIPPARPSLDKSFCSCMKFGTLLLPSWSILAVCFGRFWNQSGRRATLQNSVGTSHSGTPLLRGAILRAFLRLYKELSAASSASPSLKRGGTQTHGSSDHHC